jgi:predicted nucleic acid-binding protein
LKLRYLLDSAILIDHLRGVRQAAAWLENLNAVEAAISVVTRAEVLSGGDSHMVTAATEICDQYSCLSITLEIADLAAELRRSHRWKLPDAFQAAMALHHGINLVTRNTKDFPEKTHEFVIIPYRL